MIKIVTGVIKVLSFVVFLIMTSLFVLSYKNLPEANRVPIIVVGILGMAIYLVAFIPLRFPRFLFFPVKTKPENIGSQVWIAKLMISVFMLLITCIFSLLICHMYWSTLEHMPFNALPVAIALIALIPVVFLVYIYAAMKKQ